MKNKLTVDEFNFLVNFTEYNHMDNWVDFRVSKDGRNYAYDYDNDCLISIKNALIDISQGMYDEDLELFDKGKELWSSIVKKYKLTPELYGVV